MVVLDLANEGTSDRITQRNGIVSKTYSALLSRRARGDSYHTIADDCGVNVATVHRAIDDPDYWSDPLVEALTGERWVSVTVRMRLDDNVAREDVPKALVTGFEVRCCPITDMLFVVPSWSRAKFHPQTNAAARRKYRHDPDGARVKWRARLNWGRVNA